MVKAGDLTRQSCSCKVVPCILESVKTDVSAFVDIAVIYLRREPDFGRTKRIGNGELDIESEFTTFVSGFVSANANI